MSPLTGRFVVFAAVAAFLSTSMPALAGEPAVEPPPPPHWESSASAGLTLTRGNSDTLLATLTFDSIKKWPEDEVMLGARAGYGEDSGEKNAESASGFAQWNHLWDRFYAGLRFDLLHDAVADLEYRAKLSPLVGYYFIKTERTRLSAEVGPSFVYEKQGSDEKGYVALRLAERFEHKLNDRAKIWQSVEIVPQVDDFENYVLTAELGIDVAITDKFSLRAIVQDIYDNVPAEGRDKNDLKLITAIAYKF
jgi:putative salt-induced outer membrane protein YdiY